MTKIMPAINMMAEDENDYFRWKTCKKIQKLPDMFLMIVNLCPRKMAAKIIVNSGLVKIKVMASPT